VESFNLYDKYPLVPALIQTIHRTLAYVLFAWGIWLFIKLKNIENTTEERRWNFVFVSLLITQVLLGILTIINCIGRIPLFYGVMHQAVAMLLLTSTIYLFYISKKNTA
jgi:cytochrome c oxidase assembly protein subunit 15